MSRDLAGALSGKPEEGADQVSAFTPVPSPIFSSPGAPRLRIQPVSEVPPQIVPIEVHPNHAVSPQSEGGDLGRRSLASDVAAADNDESANGASSQRLQPEAEEAARKGALQGLLQQMDGSLPLSIASRFANAARSGFAHAPARPMSGASSEEKHPMAVTAMPLRSEAAGPSQMPKESAKGLKIAAAAEVRPRHRGVLATFAAMVLLPVVASALYLWVIAQDQYASTVGFSVRTQELQSSLDILGGITSLSGAGSSDSDILYDYIHSQEMVEDLDAKIDLRKIFSEAWPYDPVFAFDPDGSIEDLVDHWENKVRITYDSSSRLMTLHVLAFKPEEATLIANAILERSTEKINALSDEAREDATRYARIEMERALDRLKGAREAMTAFRMRTRMVDPVADLQGQMGILNSLQAQLAESYIELDLLRASTNASDPRITQAEQRIDVIKNRMEEERRKFNESEQGPGGEDYATMVAEFERLTVDREFAEQTYRVALAAFDAAQAEALRKSRYLAAHIQPTVAEKSEYPQRWTLLGLTGFFLLMAWAIGVLIFYSLRDRR